MAASAGYRGTIALRDAAIPPPIGATALAAITCWDDAFVMHGIGWWRSRAPSLPVAHEVLACAPDRRRDADAVGQDHDRRHSRHRADPPPARAARPTRSHLSGDDVRPAGRPSIDRGGADLPDRVVALGADLGVIADVRRVLTVLYCWPSWFLLTIEAAGGPFPFAAGLDPQARELRLSFADPFGRVSQLTAVVVVPESP